MGSRLDAVTDWGERAKRAKYRVAALAEECGITERQLRRYFFAKFGRSPHVWLTTHRLEGAWPLLAKGMLVKEAAAIAGFSQAQNFSRRFKRYYSETPTQARVLV